ncbi:MAG: hypothetical protein WDW36_004924 [Sanguina aurantia]
MEEDGSGHMSINQPGCFDALYASISGLGRLSPSTSARLLATLCAALGSQCQNLSEAVSEARQSDSPADGLLQQRNALLQYVFFIDWALTQGGEAGGGAVQAAAGAKKAVAKGGRSKATTVRSAKSAGQASAGWAQSRLHLLRALGLAMTAPSTDLFDSASERQRMIDTCLNRALRTLEDGAALKCLDTGRACFATIGAAAVHHKQADSVASVLLTLVRKSDTLKTYDHLPAAVAGAADFVEKEMKSPQLALQLMHEFCKSDLAGLDVEAKSDAAGVRHVAEMLQLLAELQPRVAGQCLAQLQPYFACGADQIRGAMVGILETVYTLHCSNSQAAVGTAAADIDERTNTSNTATKENCLSLLMMRSMDKASSVRTRVLGALLTLVEHGRLEPGLFTDAMELAVQRLEDGTNVQTKALALIIVLLARNLLAKHSLDPATYRETWRQAERELQELEAKEEGSLWKAGAMQGQSQTKGSATTAASHAAEGDGGFGSDTEMEDAETEFEGPDPLLDPSQSQAAAFAAPIPDTHSERRVSLRKMMRVWKDAERFSQFLDDSMPTLTGLLSTASPSVVKDTVLVIHTCSMRGVPSAPQALRSVWPLIFSREESIRKIVVNVFFSMHVVPYFTPSGQTSSPASLDCALSLAALADTLTLGESSSLAEILRVLCDADEAGAGGSSSAGELAQDGELGPRVLQQLVSGGLGSTGSGSAKVKAQASTQRNCSTIIAMLAPHLPKQLLHSVPDVMRVLTGAIETQQDAWTVRHLCKALGCLSQALDVSLQRDMLLLSELSQALVRVLSLSSLPLPHWFTAAEAAVGAIYALHPEPHAFMEPILQHTAAAVFPRDSNPQQGAGNGDTESGQQQQQRSRPSCMVSTQLLSRFVFLLGQVAIQHLVLVDGSSKRIRHERVRKEKELAAAGVTPSKAPAAGADPMLMSDSVAAEADLDTLQGALEAEILQPGSSRDRSRPQPSSQPWPAHALPTTLLSLYGRILSEMCYNLPLLQSDSQLRSSALLALTKLMAIDRDYCENNMLVLQACFEPHFDLSGAGTRGPSAAAELCPKSALEPSIRCNVLVAMGDLAFRFPNVLEPYTSAMYQPLTDPDLCVRRTCLTVLSHLILNDMMKVKGNISRIAMCLVDEDSSIQSWARKFFHTLSTKKQGQSNPIYNLLPDILSNLTREVTLLPGKFQTIMQLLLQFIKADKQTDALREKLCLRFESVLDSVTEWRSLAFCLSELGWSEKGARRQAELFKVYKHALVDEPVYKVFQKLAEHGRKTGGKKPDVVELMTEWEAKLLEASLAEPPPPGLTQPGAGRDPPTGPSSAGPTQRGGGHDDPQHDDPPHPSHSPDAQRPRHRTSHASRAATDDGGSGAGARRASLPEQAGGGSGGACVQGRSLEGDSSRRAGGRCSGSRGGGETAGQQPGVVVETEPGQPPARGVGGDMRATATAAAAAAPAAPSPAAAAAAAAAVGRVSRGGRAPAVKPQATAVSARRRVVVEEEGSDGGDGSSSSSGSDGDSSSSSEGDEEEDGDDVGGRAAAAAAAAKAVKAKGRAPVGRKPRVVVKMEPAVVVKREPGVGSKARTGAIRRSDVSAPVSDQSMGLSQLSLNSSASSISSPANARHAHVTVKQEPQP